MYKLRKIISCLLIGILLVTGIPFTTFASDYLTREDAAVLLAEDAVFYNSKATKDGILKGELSQDNDKYISRIDFLVMLTRAFGTLPEMSAFQRLKAPAQLNLKYTDVPQWATPAVNELIKKGILTGSTDKLLKPDENITRAEIETLIQRVWSLYATNPKDDLFAYAVKNNIGKSNIGAAIETDYAVDNRIYDILYDICIEDNVETAREEKIQKYFMALVDFEDRDKHGIEPIQKYVDAIIQAENHTDLEKAVIYIIEETGFNPLFTTYLTVDQNDSNKYSYGFTVYPATFYSDELENDYSGIEKAFTKYIKTIFRAVGQNIAEAEKNANKLFLQEVELAKVSLNVEESNDPSKWYTKTTFAQICQDIKLFDMEAIFKAENINLNETVYIADKGLYDYYTKLYFDGYHLEDLKRMALVSLVNAYADVLTTDLWTEQIHFNNYISGNSSYNNYEADYLMLWDAINTTQDIMMIYFEEIYCNEYYDENITAQVKALVDEIIATYENNIKNCSWMSAETKTKAVEKLNAIDYRIGHTEGFDSGMDYIEILGDDASSAAFRNDFNISVFFKDKYIDEENNEVNKQGWSMCAFDVNAAYEPNTNCIYIPAGILSAPMYDSGEGKEKTMAKLGYTIAHEISHAFDDAGSQYDAQGNMSDWWTAEDKLAFDKVCNEIRNYYDGYEAYSGIATNGGTTVGENFADICAIGCVLDILDKEENPDYKTFFEAFATVLVTDDDRAYEEYVCVIDSHARGRARVNPVASNFEQFYVAYGVTENDGMYVAPENRIKCW